MSSPAALIAAGQALALALQPGVAAITVAAAGERLDVKATDAAGRPIAPGLRCHFAAAATVLMGDPVQPMAPASVLVLGAGVAAAAAARNRRVVNLLEVRRLARRVPDPDATARAAVLLLLWTPQLLAAMRSRIETAAATGHTYVAPVAALQGLAAGAAFFDRSARSPEMFADLPTAAVYAAHLLPQAARKHLLHAAAAAVR